MAPAKSEWSINASVLNIFRDMDYNRSVITIVAHEDYIGSCVEAACTAAYKLIDLSCHEGVHPRLGAVDLVPFHPISENVCLESLGQVALELKWQTMWHIGHAATMQARKGLRYSIAAAHCKSLHKFSVPCIEFYFVSLYFCSNTNK
ncbi:Formiminotransferase cyclodeaminase N-terminal like [Halocaridina rubra]|uniref:Formiminotransferase cyclodeaminase N-terminal like n=1 Tax=Halocaridina rubra TaxID=373956 RepID=A0AAN8XTJ0_HALRR